MTHPSHLALDRHALGDASPDVAGHLETCADCRAHVASVQAPLPRPAWLDGVERKPARWRWPVLVLSAALATSLVIAVRTAAPAASDALRAKGTPAATLWLKRGEQVTAWKDEPLREGDAIRLEVAPAGFAYLAVVSLSPAPKVLYAAQPDATKATTLTPAWTLDAEGAEEHLVLVLSREALTDDAAARALGRRDADVFAIDYRLPRERP